jgi:hypothetical protein
MASPHALTAFDYRFVLPIKTQRRPTKRRSNAGSEAAEDRPHATE